MTDLEVQASLRWYFHATRYELADELAWLELEEGHGLIGSEERTLLLATLNLRGVPVNNITGAQAYTKRG